MQRTDKGRLKTAWVKMQVKLIRAGQIITGGERTEEDTPGKKGNNKKPKVITQETNNKSQTMTLTELPAKSETSCLHIMTQTMSRLHVQVIFISNVINLKARFLWDGDIYEKLVFKDAPFAVHCNCPLRYC